MATIRKRGDRQWEARIRRRGHPTTCGTFETKAQAEAWVTVIESEMVRKVYVDRSQAERVTLGQALERYRREVLPTKKGYQESYVIDAWQRHPLSDRSLAEIRPTDMVAYRDAREYEVSAKTVRLHLATISHLFTVATQEWGMGGLNNPVLAIRKPKLPQGRDRRLEGDEEVCLLAACKQAKSAWLAPLVAFALETGMRRGELLSVTWAQVDLDRRIARLEETKNGERRAVPLSSKAASAAAVARRAESSRCPNRS